MYTERTWILIARKLAGEASPQEMVELEELLKRYPDLHFSLESIEDIWSQKEAEDHQELDQAYEKHLSRLKNLGISFDDNTSGSLAPIKAGDKNRKRWLMYSVPAFAAILVFAVYWYSQPRPATVKLASVSPTSEISTKPGSKSMIVLPDGSKLWLNSGSKIVYDKDFGETSRELTLTGEGYFDIVKMPEKPFVIHTKNLDIRVLGTILNIKSYPEEHLTETSLIRGSVEITLKERPSEKIFLKPNEKLVVADNEQSLTQRGPKEASKKTEDLVYSLTHLNYKKDDSLYVETSWVYEKLIFEDEAFLDLAPRLERWYNVRIRFEDKSIENIRLTGSFEKESIAEALLALQITGGFHYQISGNEVIIKK